jgi:hypothetical protein
MFLALLKPLLELPFITAHTTVSDCSWISLASLKQWSHSWYLILRNENKSITRGQIRQVRRVGTIFLFFVTNCWLSSVCQHTVTVKQLTQPYHQCGCFFFTDLLPHTLQNLPVVILVNYLTWRNFFQMKNAFTVNKNLQHALCAPGENCCLVCGLHL